MHDESFEIVAVAQDSGGKAAAEPFYNKAQASFTCLIDVGHRVTALYGMINVPTGVWIDEEGRMVRPPEVAYSEQKRFGSIIAGDDEYAEGLRDWIEKGAASEYALSVEELRERQAPINYDRPLADAHFAIAVWLRQQGKAEAAALHFEEAQALDPDNWNYHRQEWAFDPKTSGRKFGAKFRALGDQPYYRPATLKK